MARKFASNTAGQVNFPSPEQLRRELASSPTQIAGSPQAMPDDTAAFTGDALLPSVQPDPAVVARAANNSVLNTRNSPVPFSSLPHHRRSNLDVALEATGPRSATSFHPALLGALLGGGAGALAGAARPGKRGRLRSMLLGAGAGAGLGGAAGLGYSKLGATGAFEGPGFRDVAMNPSLVGPVSPATDPSLMNPVSVSKLSPSIDGEHIQDAEKAVGYDTPRAIFSALSRAARAARGHVRDKANDQAAWSTRESQPIMDRIFGGGETPLPGMANTNAGHPDNKGMTPPEVPNGVRLPVAAGLRATADPLEGEPPAEVSGGGIHPAVLGALLGAGGGALAGAARPGKRGRLRSMLMGAGAGGALGGAAGLGYSRT